MYLLASTRSEEWSYMWWRNHDSVKQLFNKYTWQIIIIIIILLPFHQGTQITGNGLLEIIGKCPQLAWVRNIEASKLEIHFRWNIALSTATPTSRSSSRGRRCLIWSRRDILNCRWTISVQVFTTNKQTDIPLICHGSHGYIRVNFFWPV